MHNSHPKNLSLHNDKITRNTNKGALPHLHHLFICHIQLSLGQACLLQLGCWHVISTNERHDQDVLLDQHRLGAGNAGTVETTKVVVFLLCPQTNQLGKGSTVVTTTRL